MHETGFNPALIRVVLIVLFLIITQVLRARKTSRPVAKTSTDKVSPLAAVREAMRQAAEQARAQQSGEVADGEPPQVREQFQLPGVENIQQARPIEPESSWISSFLLLALLVCLFLMAYRYWAG
jgi:hypothetical protein